MSRRAQHDEQGAMSKQQFNTGDVLRYRPDTHHCRQGTAIVVANGRAVDTFWGEKGSSEGYWLRAADLADAEVLFNVGDYEEIGSDEAKWLEYHPDDRRRIGSQHEHCAVLYVRKGAKPDLSTKIANARQAVTDAESHLASAQHRLGWAQDDLAKLESQAGCVVLASTEEGR